MSSLRAVGAGDHVVICLHGWFGSAEGWGYLPEVVDRRRFTYVFPEMRGYGARRGELGTYSMEEYATDALEAVSGMAIDRFSVIGHSMGGKAAASILAQAPDRVRGMVGISPVPPSPVPMDHESRKLFFGAPGNDDNRRMIIDFTTGGGSSSAWLDDMVAFSRSNSDELAFAGAVQSWVNDDYLSAIEDRGTPIVCIVGENDPALSADVMRQTWMQAFQNVSLVELQSCGHYSMHEVPVRLVTEIEAYLGDW